LIAVNVLKDHTKNVMKLIKAVVGVLTLFRIFNATSMAVENLPTSVERDKVVLVQPNNGKVDQFSIVSSNSSEDKPLAGVAPSVSDLQKQKENDEQTGGQLTDPVNPVFAAKFLVAILPELSRFSSAIGANITLPLTTNEVDISKYTCRRFDGSPIAQIYLKNGDRFNYQNGHVAGFYAHDAYRKFPEYDRLDQFLGKINMTTNQAIELGERALKALGYREALPKPWFGGRAFVGDKEFSRYVFYWRHPGDSLEFASIEIDVESKTIKSLFSDEKSLWREPPIIELAPPGDKNADGAKP